MIKVTLGGEPNKNKAKEFPKLMISDGGTVVRFSKEGGGVAIMVDYKPVDNWYESYDWNMKVFTDYNEPITIQNE